MRPQGKQRSGRTRGCADDVGCNRADKGVKRYYRQTNGEQGNQLKVRGYICGPLQPFAAGKFDEVMAKRTERMKAEYERLLAEANGKAEAAMKRTKAYEGRVLDDAVRAAAAKAGLHTHAIDDALFRARSMFSLDETGQAVQLDESGKPVLGKDGKSPFTPTEWLEGMKEKAPHWFPASASGGGAGGGGGGNGGGGKTPENLTQAKTKEERVAVLKARLAAAGSGT